MDKTKSRKCKPIEIRCPAPFSHSWAGTGFVKKSTGKKNSGKCTSVMRKELPSFYNRPDPTVPHLKYGLFPKKASNRNTPNPNLNGTMNKSPMPLISDLHKRNVPKKRPISNNYGFEPFRNRNAQRNGSYFRGPTDDTKDRMLDFRPIAQRDFRNLSLSASTHLDIKPQLYKRTVHAL